MITSRAKLIVRKTHYKLKGIQSGGLKHLSPNPLNTTGCAGQKMLHFCAVRNKQPYLIDPNSLAIILLPWETFHFHCLTVNIRILEANPKRVLQNSCQWTEFLAKAFPFFNFTFFFSDSERRLQSLQFDLWEEEHDGHGDDEWLGACLQARSVPAHGELADARPRAVPGQAAARGPAQLGALGSQVSSRFYQLMPLPWCHQITAWEAGMIFPIQYPPHSDMACHPQSQCHFYFHSVSLNEVFAEFPYRQILGICF